MRTFFVFLLPLMLLACTDFKYAGQYSARTMDFPVPQATQLKMVGVGQYFSPATSQLAWYTTQAYLGFEVYGINNTADGLNDCGLSCAVLTLMETEYQNITNPTDALGISDFCDFVLGQFCAVQDVKNRVSQMEIYQDILIQEIPCPLLHISIHDQQGDSLVLEFIRGQQVWHDNKIGILTNDPTYDFHVKNIELYSYCSNLTPDQAISINGYSYNPAKFGYALGNFGISSDDGPVSRFARVSQYLRFLTKPKTNNLAIIVGFHLLEKVSVVPWFSVYQNNDKKYYGVTLYRIVRDHKNRVIYFSTYNDLVIKSVDIRDVKGINSMIMEDLHPVNYLNITTEMTG